MSAFRVLAFVLGLGASSLAWRFGVTDAGEIRTVLTTLVGANATLLGFLVSAGSLLYAVANTQLARNLQRTGHFANLLNDLFVCSGSFLLALLGSLAAMLVKGDATVGEDGGINLLRLLSVATVGLSALACVLLLPVGYKMWLLLSNLSPEQPNRLE